MSTNRQRFRAPREFSRTILVRYREQKKKSKTKLFLCQDTAHTYRRVYREKRHGRDDYGKAFHFETEKNEKIKILSARNVKRIFGERPNFSGVPAIYIAPAEPGKILKNNCCCGGAQWTKNKKYEFALINGRTKGKKNRRKTVTHSVL